MFTEKGQQTYSEIARRQQIWSNQLGTAFSIEELQLATQCIRRLGELIKGTNGDDEEKG